MFCQCVDAEPTGEPQTGCFGEGLHSEACRWSPSSKVLEESAPRTSYHAMPVLWFQPFAGTPPKFEVEATAGAAKVHVYSAPLYKEPGRAGKLLTTGHSSNFVMMVKLPSFKP